MTPWCFAAQVAADQQFRLGTSLPGRFTSGSAVACGEVRLHVSALVRAGPAPQHNAQ